MWQEKKHTAYQFYSWVPRIPAAARSLARVNAKARWQSSYSLYGGFLKGAQNSRFLALPLLDLVLCQKFSRLHQLMWSLFSVERLRFVPSWHTLGLQTGGRSPFFHSVNSDWDCIKCEAMGIEQSVIFCPWRLPGQGMSSVGIWQMQIKPPSLTSLPGWCPGL